MNGHGTEAAVHGRSSGVALEDGRAVGHSAPQDAVLFEGEEEFGRT